LCIIIVFFSTNLTVRLDGWLNNSLILLSTQLRWYCAFKYVCLRGRSYINTCRSYMWPVCTPASLATYLPSAHMCAGQICRKRRGRAHRPHVGSACVDIRPAPKTNVLKSTISPQLCWKQY